MRTAFLQGIENEIHVWLVFSAMSRLGCIKIQNFFKFSKYIVFFPHRYWPYLDGKIREALVLRSIKVRLLISFSRDTDPLTFNFVSSLKAICTEVPSCSLKVVSIIHIALKSKIFLTPPKKIKKTSQLRSVFC